MTKKVKFNAAQVIKHMPEKELNEYMITLEKEGPTPPPSIPPWFKPYGEIIEKMAQFMIDQLKFNQDQIKFNKKQEKNWAHQQKFNQDQLKFNKIVLKKFEQYDKLFKKHGWIK